MCTPSYCFDDILMKPLYSNINSRSEISLSTNIASGNRELILKTPLISSPMDTVTETTMAIKMALAGGLGIIHRFNTIDNQVEQVKRVKRHLQYIIKNPYTLTLENTFEDYQTKCDELNINSFCIVDMDGHLLNIITKRDIKFAEYNINSNPNLTISGVIKLLNKQINNLHSIKISDDLPNDLLSVRNIIDNAKSIMIKHNIEKVPVVNLDNKLVGLITWKNVKHFYANENLASLDKFGRLRVGAAIGIVGDYKERLEKLINVGVDLICIDVANGFNENVMKISHDIRIKYPELVLMVGNVCESQGFKALADIGIDCVRVGIGNGSICTTRGETGIGFGQFSAVNECFDCKVENNLDVKIICDGGSLGKTGNKVKALASGASAVMLGRTLAATEESPGQVIIRNGKRFKYIRGMASTMANISKQEADNSIMSSNSKKRKLNTKFTAEGVDGEQELRGSVVDLIEQINGGLRSGLSYLGSHNMTELHMKRANNEIKFCVSTAIGLSETGIRVKTY